MIINQDASNKSATINFSGYSAGGPVNSWVLTAPALDNQDNISINGLQNGYAYGLPLVEEVTPYYFNDSGTQVSVNIEKYSVMALLVY